MEAREIFCPGKAVAAERCLMVAVARCWKAAEAEQKPQTAEEEPGGRHWARAELVEQALLGLLLASAVSALP